MSLLTKAQDSCLSLDLLLVGELVQPYPTLFGMSWGWECVPGGNSYTNVVFCTGVADFNLGSKTYQQKRIF